MSPLRDLNGARIGEMEEAALIDDCANMTDTELERLLTVGMMVTRKRMSELKAWRDVRLLEDLTVERQLTERVRELPRHDPPDRPFDLRQRFNVAVRQLREAEDIARVEMPAWPTADRIRDIYEQITEDLLNGRTTVPPLRERLTTSEARVQELESALREIASFTTQVGDTPHLVAIARSVLSEPSSSEEGA